MKSVYFMRRADGVGAVKIGCSKWPESRLTAMQVWAPEPLAIIATAPGGFEDEKRLHRQFDKLRLHGEWFEPAAPLLALIARVRATGELPPAPVNDRVVRMTALYKSGKTLQEIGDEFGITRERARQILRRHDVETLGYRPSVMRKSKASLASGTVLHLAAQGNTVQEIAEAVGDAAHNVRLVLGRAGVVAKRGYKRRAAGTVEKADSVAAAYRAGEKTADIAARHGIDQPHVFRLIRIAGVEPDRQARRSQTLNADTVVLEYRAGETLEALAARHGVCSGTIRRTVAKAGALRSRAENEAIRTAAVSKANSVRRARPTDTPEQSREAA